MPEDYDYGHHNDSGSGYKALFWTLIIVLSVVGLFWFWHANRTSESQKNKQALSQQTYRPPTKRELYPPSRYLKVSNASFMDIFWALRLYGDIKNTAPVTYKDVDVEIRFYSRTGSLIASKTYPIYKFFAPGTSIEFSVKEKDKDLRHADHIRVLVADATIVNE